MPSEIVMPRLGWTMETGTVVEWLKATGDPVEAGDLIFAVESDKAITEVEALDAGILYIPDETPVGVEVPVGQALGFILAPGEAPPPYTFGGASPPPQPQDLGSPLDDDIPVDPGRAVTALNGNQAGGLPVSPRARRVAAELGVDLASVTGTGKGGRIREQDVRAAAAALPATPPEPRATPSVRKLAAEIGVDLRTVPSSRPGGRITRADLARSATDASASAPSGVATPIGPIRRSIRDRMTETARTVVPVTLTTEVDATELWQFREHLKRDLAESGTAIPSITDLLVRLSALALVDQPELNVRLDGDTLIQYDAAHIGIAVDTERGLLAPVVRDADRRSIHDIAAVSADLIARTRDGSIRGDELTGSTFTVSNLGMFEIDAFTPIINLPEVAILGVGRIVPKPVVVDLDAETIAIRRMMALSLTFDHRVVDGAPAARFLQRIKGMVERPLVPLTR